MSCMVSVQPPTQLCIGRARPARSNYMQPTVSFTRCSIPFNRRLSFNHAVEPISALVKGNHGYCFGSSLVWDFPKDNKVKCCWNKAGDLGKLEQSVTFDDIKGVDAAKTELLKIVLNIKEDNEYIKLGVKLCKGVLLTGPSRTGKTLLARAVAGKAGVSFFSVSSSELVDQDSPTGATRVRDLFREARKNSPSIIFIDEIDVVGGQRGRSLNCERDQTLCQLLTEMDEFEKEGNVLVIGATNRPEPLDQALMRPGRLSRKVRVNVPDESGRKDILAHYLKDVPMEENKEDISAFVASITTGLEWVDLENIVGDSVVLATRRGSELVTEEDIFEAVRRVTDKLFS